MKRSFVFGRERRGQSHTTGGENSPLVLGLVDSLGGLHEAIAHVRQRVAVIARRELQLRLFPLALLFLPQAQPSALMPQPARRIGRSRSSATHVSRPRSAFRSRENSPRGSAQCPPSAAQPPLAAS